MHSHKHERPPHCNCKDVKSHLSKQGMNFHAAHFVASLAWIYSVLKTVSPRSVPSNPSSLYISSSLLIKVQWGLLSWRRRRTVLTAKVVTAQSTKPPRIQPAFVSDKVCLNECSVLSWNFCRSVFFFGFWRFFQIASNASRPGGGDVLALHWEG